MLKTRVERSGGLGLLILEGEMIIDHAEELKSAFMDVLKSSSSLDFKVEGVSKVDIFGLQVLCSAHRTAIKFDKELKLIGQQPAALRDAIYKAGCSRTAACSGDKVCLLNEK